jgi:ketosteroid isomerase-like protein
MTGWMRSDPEIEWHDVPIYRSAGSVGGVIARNTTRRDTGRAMSRENVELAQALITENTDFAALLRDEDAFSRLCEAIGPLFTDDFQSVIVLPHQTRTYAGLEGLRKNWLEWLEPWATYRTSIDELMDVGERVVLLLRDYGRRRGMEAEVELISATILTFRGGRVARWEDYTDRALALEAVGLSEQDVHVGA